MFNPNKMFLCASALLSGLYGSNIYGMEPYDIFAARNDANAMRTLIAHGARDRNGETALHYAI